MHNLCTQKAARRAAKRSENIPMSQKPDEVITKWAKGANAKHAKSITERYGNKFIRNNAGGHMFSDGATIGRHFNAGKIVNGSYVSNGKHF